MEESIWSNLTQISIGVAGMAILGYVLYFFIKSHKQELEESRKERETSANALMSYVQSENHQKTEMIKKHTESLVQVGEDMKKVGENIQGNTKAIERLTDKMSK